ncbi:hypothetical protein FQA39_LY13620 [Lamprigera yunnana]|nr:hypothetical protein FQA39_LY13620 [Lamprigera yunnana]
MSGCERLDFGTFLITGYLTSHKVAAAAFADWVRLVETNAVALLVVAAFPHDFLEAAATAATFANLACLVEDGTDAITTLADLEKRAQVSEISVSP